MNERSEIDKYAMEYFSCQVFPLMADPEFVAAKSTVSKQEPIRDNSWETMEC